MDKWNEVLTAYKLTQFKTLSATAQAMGVHRSTVMRHIDTLEQALGVKLFQRNDKGYIPTDAGLEIMRLGEVTANHFSQLSSRLKSKEQVLEGTLTLTCANEITEFIMPAIVEYQRQYPQMRVNVIGDIRHFHLEYGEADIAIRAGAQPTTPDNIIWPLAQPQLVLCAHQKYIEQFALPTHKNFTKHRFIALKERPLHLPWNEWIHQNIPSKKIVFMGSSQYLLTRALMEGIGIGIQLKETVDNDDTLIEIPLHKGWSVGIWVLVHRDMRQSLKIEKFLDILL